MEELKERLLKAQMNRYAIMDIMNSMDRGEQTRKIQIAITDMEKAELMLESAINYDPLNTKSYS